MTDSNSANIVILPIVFPAALPESCATRTQQIRVRVNGKVVYQQQQDMTLTTKSEGFKAFVKALVSREPRCTTAMKQYGAVPNVSEETLRKVGPRCEAPVLWSSDCAIGTHTCFAATFPAKSETLMIITYRYLGMPDAYFKSFGADEEEPGLRAHQFPEYATHKGVPALPPPRSFHGTAAGSKSPWDDEHDPWTIQQSVDFVLSTGARWKGKIGKVKLTLGVRDLPFNLRLCYGKRCARFDRDHREKLSGLSASIENSKGRTIWRSSRRQI